MQRATSMKVPFCDKRDLFTERNIHVSPFWWRQRSTYRGQRAWRCFFVAKETCIQRETFMEVLLCDDWDMHMGLFLWRKRPIYVCGETFMKVLFCDGRDLNIDGNVHEGAFLWQRDLYTERNIHDSLFLWRKRPIWRCFFVTKRHIYREKHSWYRVAKTHRIP